MNYEITEQSGLAEIGAAVCSALQEVGMSAFLSGGAVVSIYTNNKYQSYDLDFVSLEDRAKIKRVMESLGFTQEKSRLFIHPRSKFFVEFPGSALTVGEELIREFSEISLPHGTLRLLTPTDCVKDRLAAFFHWNDRQALDQAVWVTESRSVDLQAVERWSKNEGMSEKFQEFAHAVRALKKSK